MMTANRYAPATWTPAQNTVMDAVSAYGALGVLRTLLDLYPELTVDLGLATHPLLNDEATVYAARLATAVTDPVRPPRRRWLPLARWLR